MGTARVVDTGVVGSVGFTSAMWLQARSRRYNPRTYWFAVLGAVGALGLFGGTADIAAVVILVLVGTWLGFGGLHQLGVLWTHGEGVVGLLRSVWLLPALAGVLAVAGVGFWRLRHRTGARHPAWRQLRGPAVELLSELGPSARPGQLLGGAAGSASPLSAGIGTTEVALTAVLIADGVPSGQALHVVLRFRLLTFWLPAAVGLLAARYLVRRRAL